MEQNKPDTESFEKIYEWLNIYKTSDNKKAQDLAKARIVSHMLPVVHKIARTIARRADDPIEDMVQAGSIGLLKAIDKFSYEKNDNFRVFAGYYIIGEMKHYLRDKLSAIRVPRHIQELAIRIHKFTSTLTPEELKLITNEEVAYALEATPSSVDLAMQIDRRRFPVYLEDVYSNPDMLGFEEILADENYKNRPEYEDAKIILNDILLKLPAQERVVVNMYYKRNMNQKEIAEALKMSQMSVTRRMKQAFNTISSLIVDDITNEEMKKGNYKSEN